MSEAEQALTSMYTQQSERIEAIQGLMEEMWLIQKENKKSEDVMERVQEIIEQSSKIVEHSEAPHEMILDAKILHAGTQVVSSSLLSLDTNLTSFDEDKYVKGMISYINEVSQKPESDYAWECLKPITFPLVKRTIPKSFMLGTFSLDPPPKKEVKKAVRLKKGPEAEKTVLETCSQQETTIEEINNDVYEHIFKCLVKAHRKNNKAPVNYLKFVIDPVDYWTTVENIFHFSFLVRDDSVKMSLDEKGVPVVEPVISKQSSTGLKIIKKNQQFSFRITQHEWRNCIDTFQIKNASISPFEKK